MSDISEQFITAVLAELRAEFGPRQYVVEDREPIQGELKATAGSKQLFVVTDGLQSAAEDNATGGESIRVVVPVFVLLVLRRPGDTSLSGPLRDARKQVQRALMRARSAVLATGPDGVITLLGEALGFEEGLLVSTSGAEVEFSLTAEEEA